MRDTALNIAERLVKLRHMADRNSLSYIVEPIYAMLLAGVSPLEAESIADDLIQSTQHCGFWSSLADEQME